jgi:4-amino-4-deoxy-L-arabinose transferase-like glycosyltransferase
MTPGLRSGALCTVWVVWTAVVVTHYFTVPADRFHVFEGPIGFPEFWREAVVRGVLAIAAATAITLAAWTVGQRLSQWFVNGLFAESLEALVFQLAIGFASLSYALFALACVGLYRGPVVGGIVILLAVCGCLSAPRVLKRAVRSFRVPRRADVGLVLCAGAAVACGLIAALAPETEYDALWYHLHLPARWLAVGRPIDLIEEYISLYPLAWEMLYGAAMALGGPVAAKGVHFVCLPLVAMTASLLTARLFPRANPWVAAALVVTAPTVLWESTTAYIDLALAWYMSLAVYALLRYDRLRDRRWLIVGAIVMGTALGIKHLGLVALAITSIVLAVREARVATGRSAARTVAVFAAIALAIASPWYVRAYAASGNPVFPEMYAVFGARPGTRWSPDAERSLRRFKDHFGRSRTAAHLATLPWDVTVHSASYGGTFGPLFLILVPAAASWHRRERAPAGWVLFAGCAAYIAVWASPVSSFQLRFLVPVVPLLAPVAAHGAMRIGEAAEVTLRHGGAATRAVLVVLLLTNLPPAIEWHERDRVGWSDWLTHVIRGLPVGVVVGVERENDYLARVVPSYRAWHFIDTMLPPSSRVLSFSGGDNLYSDRSRIPSDAIVAHEATWGTEAGEERVAVRALIDLGVTHVLFDKRQFETGSVRAIAIGTEEMRRCCLALVYEDHRFALYEVRPGPS